jgi:hypothetical protein
MHHCHSGVASCKEQHGIDCIKVFHDFNASISRCIMHGSRTRAVGFFNNGFIVAEEAVDCRNISILGSLKDCNLGTCGRDWTDTWTHTHTHTSFHTLHTTVSGALAQTNTQKEPGSLWARAKKTRASLDASAASFSNFSLSFCSASRFALAIFSPKSRPLLMGAICPSDTTFQVCCTLPRVCCTLPPSWNSSYLAARTEIAPALAMASVFSIFVRVLLPGSPGSGQTLPQLRLLFESKRGR